VHVAPTGQISHKFEKVTESEKTFTYFYDCTQVLTWLREIFSAVFRGFDSNVSVMLNVLVGIWSLVPEILPSVDGLSIYIYKYSQETPESHYKLNSPRLTKLPFSAGFSFKHAQNANRKPCPLDSSRSCCLAREELVTWLLRLGWFPLDDSV